MSRRTGGRFHALASAARPAPESLGWPGLALPPLCLLGSWIAPVVCIDHPAHHRRLASGDGPQLDQDTLTIWEWPESTGRSPSSVIELSGVIVWAGTWRTGLAEAQSWRGFGPSAAAGPPALTDQAGVFGIREFALAGVGLVEHGTLCPLRVVVGAEPGRLATARRRVLDRWVEESLYRHALAVGLLRD